MCPKSCVPFCQPGISALGDVNHRIQARLTKWSIIPHQKVVIDNVIRHTHGSEGWPRESFVVVREVLNVKHAI